MFDIPVNGPAFIYADNHLVLVNSSAPESTLNIKSQNIAFHFIREVCAADEWRTKYIHRSLNISDLISKQFSGGKHWRFLRMLLQHILCGAWKFQQGRLEGRSRPRGPKTIHKVAT